jgi:MFS transporter, DHA1 family, tetracycline resistance protein
MKAMGPKKQLLVILLIVFFGFLGISMPYLIFPTLFLNPEYSILSGAWGESSRVIFLGVTLAAYPLGQFIGSPILGALSDDYGRKGILLVSLVVAAFCYLLSGIAIQLGLVEILILSRFLAGLMEGNISIARAMAADIKSISKHRSFGLINAATSIAYLLGPLMGGILTHKSIFGGLTMSTPFYLISVLFFVLTPVSFFLLKESVQRTAVQAKGLWERFNLLKRLKKLFQSKRLKFLLVVVTVFSLAADTFFEFGPVYLTIKWALDPSQLATYNVALALGITVGAAWLPSFFTSKMAIKWAICCFMGGFALFLSCIAFANSTFTMLVLFGLCGLAIGAIGTLVTVKISDSAPDSIQGEVLGVQLSLRVLGDALICLFGSLLLLYSLQIVLLIAAAISVFIMFYYFLNTSKIT